MPYLRPWPGVRKTVVAVVAVRKDGKPVDRPSLIAWKGPRRVTVARHKRPTAQADYLYRFPCRLCGSPLEYRPFVEVDGRIYHFDCARRGRG